MPDDNDTAQYSTCGKCGGRIVRQGKAGWYHTSPPLHYPRHYAEPMRAVFSPNDFLATAAQLSRHLGLVGEIA